MNKRESSRVRIGCVSVIKDTVPSHSTLQLLAHCLRNEPSTQFKTFIYTTLVSLAQIRTHVPELKHM